MAVSEPKPPLAVGVFSAGLRKGDRRSDWTALNSAKCHTNKEGTIHFRHPPDQSSLHPRSAGTRSRPLTGVSVVPEQHSKGRLTKVRRPSRIRGIRPRRAAPLDHLQIQRTRVAIVASADVIRKTLTDRWDSIFCPRKRIPLKAKHVAAGFRLDLAVAVAAVKGVDCSKIFHGGFLIPDTGIGGWARRRQR